MAQLFIIFVLAMSTWAQPANQPSSNEEIQAVSFENASWVSPDRLKMTFVVKEGHKIYKESLKLRSRHGQELSFKNVVIQPLITFEDKYTKTTKQGVHDTFEITADVFAKEEIKDDNYPLTLEYQACSEEYCLFPQDFDFNTSLVIKNSSFSLNRLMSESLLLAIIFVFFAGFLTSFTPCIFPMIPLTLAVLVPRGKPLSFTQKLYRSLTYVFGIALTYSLFGVIAASSGIMFGSLLGNKYVAVGIAFFFVLFAISMLGFFEIKTPSKLQNSQWLNNSNTFVFGLAAGVIAGPCVGPVLLSILTFISQTGNVQTGFVLMMSFAFGMGLIFIVLGIAGDVFHLLPKSGNWLNNIKYIFSSIMLGLSIYYVLPVLSFSELIIYIEFVLLTIVACYFLFYEKKFNVTLSTRAKKFLKINALGLIFGLVITSFFAKNINTSQTDLKYSNGWTAYNESQFEKILQNGKPTVVDFYADWCMACKELKNDTFSNEIVIQEGKDFNLLVVDATQNNPLIEKLKKEHHVIGLPTLIFYNKTGVKKEDLTLNGFEKAEDFVKRLKKAKE
jgi:thioredoxin:protein disulfide reductase